MKAEELVDILESDFFAGVPDSQLKAFIDCIYSIYKTDPDHHIIAANEGNAVAIGAGYYLATGKIPVIYMQNSGEGNAVNPICSLLNERIYSIPMIFVIGWRGEKGVHDEPQHSFQGEITLKLLDLLEIPYFAISPDTTPNEAREAYSSLKKYLDRGKQIAFVVRKGALSFDGKAIYENPYTLKREEAIEEIAKIAGDDLIVSTTGKASRELFEIRERENMSHDHDFLTVGSMGHTSSIALGLALGAKERRVWCIDGDGSMIMHMGSLPVIGSIRPHNLIHIAINNTSHESVGGQPTAAKKVSLSEIAKASLYPNTATVSDKKSLIEELKKAKDRDELSFIEVLCDISSRDDLGRPTTTPIENKEAFMNYIGGRDEGNRH